MLALRDYFREQFEEIKRQRSNGTTPTSSRIRQEDEWTLEYINVTRLQPIIEAFDEDGSGFVSVTEANRFTAARPNGWRCPASFNCHISQHVDVISSSLLRWLAYWAIGS